MRWCMNRNDPGRGGSELVVQDILSFVDADLYALIDFFSRVIRRVIYGRSIRSYLLYNIFPFCRVWGTNGRFGYLPGDQAVGSARLRYTFSSSHAVAKAVARANQVHITIAMLRCAITWDLTFDYLAHGNYH
jgi:hypothetical protein